MRLGERSVQDLVVALTSALRGHILSPEHLTHAMKLAYEHGLVDGKLELADKMMAQDIRQIELRG